MQEKRSMQIWRAKFTIPFLVISVSCIAILLFLGFSSFVYLAAVVQDVLCLPNSWTMGFVWFLFLLSLTILAIFVCMFIVLFRTVGALPRIEKILDKVINGDYSARISVRKKDTIYSLTAKLNQIIDLLEKKSKS
jgi:HAMP domain-containing protein